MTWTLPHGCRTTWWSCGADALSPMRAGGRGFPPLRCDPSTRRPCVTGSFWRFVLLMAGKDLRIEGRSREVLYTMGFSAALVVLIFSFALATATDPAQGPITAAGVLWAATLLTGTVALARVIDRERESEAIRSLLLSPAPRASIYLGKLIATATLMVLVEA